MNKIWFTLINDKQEGPWDYEDLKNDSRITPDSLIWKKGFENWKKIRDVPELKSLFEENSKDNNADNVESEILEKKTAQSELVLDIGQEPPYFIWLLLILLVLLYVVIQLYI